MVANLGVWRIAVKTLRKPVFVLSRFYPYHGEMQLLFLLLTLSTDIWAAPKTVSVLAETPVYQAPGPDAHVLFYLHSGEEIKVLPSQEWEYLQVRVKRSGKVRSGFVLQSDLESKAVALGAGKEWGIGLGAEYGSLSQKGKSFETDDQVQYTTTEYKSTFAAPLFAVQYGQGDFWRLIISQKQTRFRASASTNVAGASAQNVDLQQTFLSGVLQKTWSPFGWSHFYFGPAVEIAKATAVALTLGGKALPTTSDDRPAYLGVAGLVGANAFLFNSISGFLELSVEVIANQSPPIYQIQAAFGLFYWP